jgi:hypothetical protein
MKEEKEEEDNNKRDSSVDGDGAMFLSKHFPF